MEVGTPILKLDLQSTETEYKKLLDEEQMRRYKLDQLRVNNQTKLSDMAMQIKVSAMKLSRMKVELEMNTIWIVWEQEPQIKCVRQN